MHSSRRSSDVPDNELLRALPRDVRQRYADRFERFHLALGETIYQPGARVDVHVFPIDAVVSVVTVLQDGTQIEVITVGREGLTGAQALLDRAPAVALTYCQVPGDAYRIPSDMLTTLCREDADVRSLVERYLSANIDVMAQSIACNRLHYVNERCARWLLMTHDRVGRDEFPLTHQILATMLGVRRAGVSIAAAALQEAGFIRYSRGRFTVVDRDGLESACCECYRAITDAFARRRLPAA
ncbi:MAG: Crp/Fnr family transcriptional regulator [Candidatus Eremiobacteraeota bacterium]|nr:Crp/Fnr family transcriptional regulator [Candidatus Eremiobacteraeota bacterium]